MIQLIINGADVSGLIKKSETDASGLIASVSLSGSSLESARTLTLSILQSAYDARIPVIDVRVGTEVKFYGDGQLFEGKIINDSRSTSSNTVDVRALDGGVYVNNNKITHKISGMTAEQTAEALALAYGIPVGELAWTGFKFSRNYAAARLYDAIMTGYALAGKESGKKYQMIFRGKRMCIREMTDDVAGVILPKYNLIEAAFSENAEKLVNQIDIYDKKGGLVRSVKGDTTMGVFRDVITQKGKKDDSLAQAQDKINAGKPSRKTTCTITGDSEMVSGNAALLKEEQTGLFGLFYIASDAHTWKNSVYTTKLGLEWEKTMTETEAGEAIKAAKSKKKGPGEDFGLMDREGTYYRDKEEK